MSKLLTATGLVDPRDPLEKMKKIEDLVGIINGLRGKEKIVATNGCFDILHLGHVRALRESKEQGDILVVGINTDDNIRERKGTDRPIYTQNERGEMLASLECVDFVTLFKDSCKFVEAIKPDVFTNGCEYGMNCIEAPIVKKYGGKVYLYKRQMDPKGSDYNTTNLIKRIRGN